MKGYPYGAFKPEENVTRAEFAEVLSKFNYNVTQNINLQSPFKDIIENWAEKAIISEDDDGIIKGYPNGKFKPQQLIIRAEGITMLNRYINLKVQEIGAIEVGNIGTEKNLKMFKVEIGSIKIFSMQ